MIYIITLEHWDNDFNETVFVTNDFSMAVQAFTDIDRTARYCEDVLLQSYVENSKRPKEGWWSEYRGGVRVLRHVIPGEESQPVTSIEETP